MTVPMTLRGFACRAFDWIQCVAVPVDDGVAWSEGGVISDDLYGGTAGVLLACAEASAAGLDLSRIAVRARDRLIYLVEQRLGLPDDGLFTGWAGVALALRAWARVAVDERAAGAAREVSRRIAERVAARDVDSVRYYDVVLGDAGILLGLVGDRDTGEAIAILADGLVAAAESAAGRVHWRMEPGYAFLMPGFSHGTAGVAYALLVAGCRLRRPGLIDLTVRAATDLIALGQREDGWALPVTLPRYPNRPTVNFGWCHGATGTVRLFAALERVDVHPRWSAAADACLEALHSARLPIRRYPGFWDNLACCCGTAGVGRLLLDRFELTGQRRYLEESARLAADVLNRRVESAHGVTWSNTDPASLTPQLPPEAGFMQGSAGIASWLARLAAVAAGERPVRLDPAWI